MPRPVLCLDTSIFIKYLTPEEHSVAATRLVERGLSEDVSLVAPSWIWAEVGTVLRKKIRNRLLEEVEADTLWGGFLDLPISFVDSGALRNRAWEIARQFDLLTVYDAAFLACTEVAAGEPREFWTADMAFVRSLGALVPDYVHALH